MTEGNVSTLVQLSKTQLLIERGFGLTIPQQASKHGLSTSQMRLALEECKIIKERTEERESSELTERERKFNEVAETWSVEPEDLNQILEQLGLSYKTGRRSTKGIKKYTIIDDLTAVA